MGPLLIKDPLPPVFWLPFDISDGITIPLFLAFE
jgi:hypothetical protein